MYPVSEQFKSAMQNGHTVAVLLGDSGIYHPFLVGYKGQDATFDVLDTGAYTPFLVVRPALVKAGDILHVRYSAALCSDRLNIGRLCAATIEIEVYGRHKIDSQTIRVIVGAGEPTEWVPLGTFVVTSCAVTDETTIITAYDAAYAKTGVSYIPAVSPGETVAAVLEDVCQQCGIPLGTLPELAQTTSVDGVLTGYQGRDMISMLAALVGTNAVINRDGALELRWLTDNGQTITPDDYYQGGLSRDDPISVTGLSVRRKDTVTEIEPDTGAELERDVDSTFSAGDASGVVIHADNAFGTQAATSAAWNHMGALTYNAATVSAAHHFEVEPGDILHVTALDGTALTVPVMGLTLELDGGCKATVESFGVSVAEDEAAFLEPMSAKMEELSEELSRFKNLHADNFSAVVARIGNLYADKAFIDALFAQDITATGTITGATLVGANLRTTRTEGQLGGLEMHIGENEVYFKVGTLFEGQASLRMGRNEYEGESGGYYSIDLFGSTIRLNGESVLSQIDIPRFVQNGYVTISPNVNGVDDDGNPLGYVPVTFPHRFSGVPNVTVTPITNRPGVCSVSVDTITNTGFRLYMENPTNDEIGVSWIAVKSATEERGVIKNGRV